MKYNEIKVKFYGTAESGPLIELENGKRVYGLAAAAPELLQALRDINSLLAEYAHAGAGRPVNPNHYRGANGLCPGEIALSAIANATGQN